MGVPLLLKSLGEGSTRPTRRQLPCPPPRRADARGGRRGGPPRRAAPRCPGRPARAAVCAKAAAVSVGSVTVSSDVPRPAKASIPACRSTASTRTAVSKPTAEPVRAPALSRLLATRRAAAATGRRASSPSPSTTWSLTFAEASTSETEAVRMPRRGQGLVVRRRPGRPPGLSLRQDGDDEAVVVGDDAGELPVVTAQCEAQAAQVRHPLGLQSLAEAMATGPDDSEQDDFPERPVVDQLPHRSESRSPVRTRRHPYAVDNHISLCVSVRAQYGP